MTDVRESVMPRQVRIARWLLYGLASAGLVTVLAVSEGMSSYEAGKVTAPWPFVWVCALLALTYGGRARGGVRLTTAGLLVFVVLWSVSQAFGARGPDEFVDAALRIALGLPVLVLLFRPEVMAWFDREK
jgi:hypothetical protein